MARSRRASPGSVGLVLFCACGSLFAQKVVSARAGLISYLQGPAFIDDKRVVLKTGRFPQMKDGEILSTGRGRAELLLAPGVVLRLAETSKMRMEDTDLSDTRITLLEGEALIEVVQLAEGNRVQVASGDTTTEFARPGLYRLGISQNATHDSTAQNALRVYGGEALVRCGLNMADAKRGMAVNLNTELTVSRFDRKQKDFFHTWAARRSFDLFMSDPDARNKQTHWQPAGGGYVENKNFGIEFRAFIRRGPPAAIPPVPPAEKQH